MRRCTSAAPLGILSRVYSLIFPRAFLQPPPRSCTKLLSPHSTQWKGSVFQDQTFQMNSFPSGKKHCLVQSTKFPGLGLPGSILDTPVGIISSAKRREAVCFVLFLLPVDSLPTVLVSLTESNPNRRESYRTPRCWAGSKIDAHKYTADPLTTRFELCGPPYMWIFFSSHTTVLHNLWMMESTDVES